MRFLPACRRIKDSGGIQTWTAYMAQNGTSTMGEKTDAGPASIFLIGMMACGKSTVCRHLARRLGWEFYDIDRAVEERCGVPISFIFEKEGEAGFRARETQMMSQLMSRPGIVVATGGGAPMFEINRRILSQGLVIQLATTVSDILERTQRDTSRPLLQSEDKIARIRNLMLERGPVYDSLCAHKIMTTRKAPAAVAEKILTLKEVREVVARGNRLLAQIKHNPGEEK